jgi:hypothetical protein
MKVTAILKEDPMIVTQWLCDMLVLFNSGIKFRACVSIRFIAFPQGFTTFQLDSL